MEQGSGYQAYEASIVATELDFPCWQYNQPPVDYCQPQDDPTEKVREGKAQINTTPPAACPHHNETPFRAFCLEILLGLLFVLVLCLFALP